MSYRVIHEGEYSNSQLPISTSTSGFETPVRLNSPNMRYDEKSHSLPSSLLPQSSSSQDTSPFSPFAPSSLSPTLLHKWSHTHSILCVVAAPSKRLVYCGTQDSKILVFDMVSYELKDTISLDMHYHCDEAVLCLALTEDENFLFSAGANSIVKVWDLTEKNITCSHIIYSLVDIGDIFSLAWSSALGTLFIGAQNASILWTKLCLKKHTHAPQEQPPVDRLPYRRYDKFFDSKGPGGSINSRQTKHFMMKQTESKVTPKLVEMGVDSLIRFAHNGYVYCMAILTKSGTHFVKQSGLVDDNCVLVSCGGDGVVNVWEIQTQNGLNLKKVKSLQNEESILSMTVSDYLYVGLSNSTINVWDLATFQLVRSVHFGAADCGVLSVGIHNGCIFKASSKGGLVKFARNTTQTRRDDKKAQHPPTVRHVHSPQATTNASAGSDLSCPSPENDPSVETLCSDVLSITIFTLPSGATYLASGGHKAFFLWDVSNVGTKKETEVDIAIPKFSNDDMLRRLRTFISYKTISKLPTLYLEDSRHCAQFLIKLLIDLGSQQTKLLPVPNGNPTVYGLFRKNSSKYPTTTPRVMWYAHYDVVNATANEANDWKTDPFTLTALDGNLYARGVSDNKGPTLAAIYAVAELHQKKELSCDVVFIIEGEEECGSVGFQQAISENHDLIGNIDWVMLSNSYWLDDETPCLNYGLRGVINASVTVKSEKPDRHAGVDGGVSKEPTMDLVQVLSDLVDRKADRINIDGFYDDVLELTDQESGLLGNIANYAANKKIINQDLKTLIAKWRNPSLTVHKIQVSGPNNNTVIPQVAKATISIRIVPNQNLSKTKDALVSYLHKRFNSLGSHNTLDVDIFHEAEPWLGDPNNLVYKLLYDKIISIWDVEPLYVREGGSIPSIRFLEKEFGAPAAQIPCGQASDNAHLMDEKLRITNLFKLRAILSESFRDLGERQHEQLRGGDT